jgi:cytoskeletal protein CcmA (bactofilin family)
MAFKTSDNKAIDTSALAGILQDGVHIDGRLSFTGTVLLDGRLTGEIETTGALIVGPKADVNATIKAADVTISGRVQGSIIATNRVELRASGRLTGDVETQVLVIDRGAMFDGRCRMPQAGSVGSTGPAIVP